MRTAITSQQAAFFTQNGYLELGGFPFDPTEVFAAAQKAAAARPFGRDLWRSEAVLHRLLSRTLAPAALQLHRKSLRIACDQWMPAAAKPLPAKDLFCVQGLALCALLTSSETPPPPRRPAAIGILPFPSRPENILFVKPNIVLDWPILSKTPRPLFLVAYALPNQTVYVYNQSDPATHELKGLGYSFGDRLSDPHHPLLK